MVLHVHTSYRHYLDGSSVKKQDKFTSPFRVILEVEWNRATEEQATYNAASWQNLPYPKAHPLTCFSSNVEEEETAKMLRMSLVIVYSVHVHNYRCTAIPRHMYMCMCLPYMWNVHVPAIHVECACTALRLTKYKIQAVFL